MNKDDSKQVAKEALKEWLDERFAEFGKWSLKTASVLVFTAIVYFVLRINGWAPLAEHAPPIQVQGSKPPHTVH